MENDYRIEQLASTFAKHADDFDESCRNQREAYPDSDPVLNNFNLPRALSVMAAEIDRLKNLVG
jgi:hypothetical protein